jgi:hypothetical protein
LQLIDRNPLPLNVAHASILPAIASKRKRKKL